MRPGQHPALPSHVEGEEDAFSLHVTTGRLQPTHFLGKGSGLGGTSNAPALAALKAQYAASHALAGPPRAFAKAPRPNPPNSDFRRHYERSDLPCCIMHTSPKSLKWGADIGAADFDLRHFLPIFFAGLREVEEPFRFVAEQGIADLLAANDEERVLQKLVAVGPQVGAALVPYYRQILPVLNIFAGKSVNLGDKMDFAQRKGHLGELIQETLQKMEMSSGPDAYINIKYMVPLYESCMLL